MNMYNLFKKLPRDLQWEVLTEFVGTHSVRKGKLIKKIAYSTQNNHLHRHIELNDTYVPVVNGVRVRYVFPWLTRRETEKQYIRFRSLKALQFVEDPLTGETIICRHKVISFIDMWEVKFAKVEDTTSVLPPFVKHTYPSYPFTAKKNKLRIR